MVDKGNSGFTVYWYYNNQISTMYASIPCASVDPTWFMDFGASHNVTSNLANLAVKQEFEGNQ